MDTTTDHFTPLVLHVWGNWASEVSPTLGCSIEISRDWASKASPTLGCSIEISRDIYMYVGMYVGMSVCLSYVKLTV